MDEYVSDEVIILDSSSFWKDFFQTKFSSETRKFIRKYPSSKSIYIPYNQIVEFGVNGIHYAEYLIKNPEKALIEINESIKTNNIFQKKGESLDVQVRFTNLERKTNVRDLRGPIHVGTLVSVEGQIRKTASRKERLVEAVFRCNRGHRTIKKQPYALKEFPSECSAEGCKARNLELLESASTFIDSQKALLQEHFELVNPGSQPETIEIELTEDLIDTLYAGNRVIINGILKRYQTGSSKSTTIYKNYIEVNSVEVTEKEYAEITISEADEEQIKSLAADPAIYDRLTKSVVPSIYGLEQVKRSSVYAFFGGLSTESENGVNVRGSIHILLIGEPGIAKTDFMRKVMAYSPRGVYTSGKGSSGVGLVASVQKDEFGDGNYTLEAGAMALADMGICVIDEIGQIEKKDLSLLYEALESQRASIHKANIHTCIPTRCSVIAAANPKDGWIDDFIPLKDQIDLPGAFLQRFDLIYILRDEVNLEKDEQIIRRMIANRSGDSQESAASDIEESLFRKYVAYAKQQPLKWSKPATDEVVNYYLGIRKSREKRGVKENKPVPITPRQGNSLSRLAEASARIRLSPKVEMVDVTRGKEILDECLRAIAYDPETGVFDIGNAETGKTKKLTDLEKEILKTIDQLADDHGIAKESEVISGVGRSYDKYDVENLIEKMTHSGGRLSRPRPGFIKAVA